MVVKYRRKVINDEISEYLKHRFVVVGQAYGVNLQEWNHDQDHVHVLFRATPHTEMAKFLNAYKSSSSRMVKKTISRNQAVSLEISFLDTKLLLN